MSIHQRAFYQWYHLLNKYKVAMFVEYSPGGLAKPKPKLHPNPPFKQLFNWQLKEEKLAMSNLNIYFDVSEKNPYFRIQHRTLLCCSQFKKKSHCCRKNDLDLRQSSTSSLGICLFSFLFVFICCHCRSFHFTQFHCWYSLFICVFSIIYVLLTQKQVSALTNNSIEFCQDGWGKQTSASQAGRTHVRNWDF